MTHKKLSNSKIPGCLSLPSSPLISLVETIASTPSRSHQELVATVPLAIPGKSGVAARNCKTALRASLSIFFSIA
ncbi:hypothetical protein [Chamaesiphon minutus]|uniref:hypothetical protein n=1 Tax=Chamaesiphon minutus TaxID=1173032 RepID=UPI0018DEEA9E|nr:hypothetical protein [Chamaesiphon minutus]